MDREEQERPTRDTIRRIGDGMWKLLANGARL